MEFIINRQDLLKPLSAFSSMVERNSAIVVLSNILMTVSDNKLTMVASNSNVEIKTTLEISDNKFNSGSTTISSQKLLEIVRLLPENQDIHFLQDDTRMVLTCAGAKYHLLTLPAEHFPIMESEINLQKEKEAQKITITQGKLKFLLDQTYFSMGNKDIRRVLNGLLIEVSSQKVKAISTDGHRLSHAYIDNTSDIQDNIKFILPRKSVTELIRILPNSEDDLNFCAIENFIKISFGNYIFISKLLSGDFPKYDHIVGSLGANEVCFPKQNMVDVLNRTKVLSNSRCGMNLTLGDNKAVFFARNVDNEDSEEVMDVDYNGEKVDLGLNIRYLLDIANVIEAESLKMIFADKNTSVVIKCDLTDSTYVVMPLML